MKKAVRDTMPIERIKEIINYDPLTGEFTWKAKTRHNMPAVGKKAGGMRNNYYYIRIDEVDYLASRIAWAIITGESPNSRIAFKDKNASNLKWDNFVLQDTIKGFDHNNREDRLEYSKAYYTKNSQKERKRKLKSKFNITLRQYEAMFVAQSGKCAICEQCETAKKNGKDVTLSVDHCHTSGKVRGLLCKACNLAIGSMKDNIKSLQNAISYLSTRQSESLPASNVIPLKRKES